MVGIEANDLISLLCSTPARVRQVIQTSCLPDSQDDSRVPTPDIKEYSDATYYTYFDLGLSLCYTSTPRSSDRLLSHIDIVNPLPSNQTSGANRRGKKKDPLAGYQAPNFPITFRFANTVVPIQTDTSKKPSSSSSTPLERELEFRVDEKTTGKDFVGAFGEPARKSEGQAGYVEPSLEWNRVELEGEDGQIVQVGIMVDLREPNTSAPGQEAQGGQGASIWDRAGSYGWSTLKLFIAETS